jgi:hypothetical protein
MGNGPAGRFKVLMDVILKSEVLDELPEVGPDPKRLSVFSRLMKSEELPYDAPPEAVRHRFIARLFSREQLPFDPIPARDGSRRGSGG